MDSFDSIDKLPHSATAKSMMHENMSADSLNVLEAAWNLKKNHQFLIYSNKIVGHAIIALYWS